MRVYYDRDADLNLIKGKKVVIVGYGSQGHAHALNLKESGYDVVVGLRDGSASADRCASDGVASAPIEQAVSGAGLVMLLAPDETLAALYRIVEPHLAPDSALGFSHGLAVRTEEELLVHAGRGRLATVESLHVLAIEMQQERSTTNAAGLRFHQGQHHLHGDGRIDG